MANKLGPPWREAPDSWGGTQRSVMVAFPSRRTVGAKKTRETEVTGHTEVPSVY